MRLYKRAHECSSYGILSCKLKQPGYLSPSQNGLASPHKLGILHASSLPFDRFIPLYADNPDIDDSSRQHSILNGGGYETEHDRCQGRGEDSARTDDEGRDERVGKGIRKDAELVLALRSVTITSQLS